MLRELLSTRYLDACPRASDSANLPPFVFLCWWEPNITWLLYPFADFLIQHISPSHPALVIAYEHASPASRATREMPFMIGITFVQ